MIGSAPLDLSAPRLADVADPSYNLSGVYALWLNGECVYVGYSGHLRTRIVTHRQQLRKGNHPSGALQLYFSRHQNAPFMATILPYLPGERRQELAWLTRLRPLGNTDTSSADFKPTYRKARRQARTLSAAAPCLELTVKEKGEGHANQA